MGLVTKIINIFIEQLISRSVISNCLNGLSKTAGGYIWKYSNEQLTNDYIEYVNSRKNRNIKNKNYEILNTERK